MDTPNIIPIQKNQDSIKDTILTNVIKMLTNRGLLEKSKLEENIKKLLDSKPDDFSYEVKTLKGEIIVKLLLQNVTTVSKTTGIAEFLTAHKNKDSILVVKNITKTPLNIVTTRYEKTQLFLEKDLMIDKVNCNLVPKFEVLNEEEKQSYFDKYNVTKSGSLKISYKDPMVKYYGAKPGDVVRVIRVSPTSGFTVSYRLVVKKELN